MKDVSNQSAPDGLDDMQSQDLERAMFGTSQHGIAVVDSHRWGRRKGHAELLADVQKRLEATSQLWINWLSVSAT